MQPSSENLELVYFGINDNFKIIYKDKNSENYYGSIKTGYYDLLKEYNKKGLVLNIKDINDYFNLNKNEIVYFGKDYNTHPTYGRTINKLDFYIADLNKNEL